MAETSEKIWKTKMMYVWCISVFSWIFFWCDLRRMLWFIGFSETTELSSSALPRHLASLPGEYLGLAPASCQHPQKGHPSTCWYGPCLAISQSIHICKFFLIRSVVKEVTLNETRRATKRTRAEPQIAAQAARRIKEIIFFADKLDNQNPMKILRHHLNQRTW